MYVLVMPLGGLESRSIMTMASVKQLLKMNERMNECLICLKGERIGEPFLKVNGLVRWFQDVRSESQAMIHMLNTCPKA